MKNAVKMRRTFAEDPQGPSFATFVADKSPINSDFAASSGGENDSDEDADTEDSDEFDADGATYTAKLREHKQKHAAEHRAMAGVKGGVPAHLQGFDSVNERAAALRKTAHQKQGNAMSDADGNPLEPFGTQDFYGSDEEDRI